MFGYTLYLPLNFLELSMASYYGDHMVLQRAPRAAVLWGYADTLGEGVRVRVGRNASWEVAGWVVHHAGLGRNVWTVRLLPMSGKAKNGTVL